MTLIVVERDWGESMRGVRPVVQGEEREEAVRPDRGLSAGPSSCRLVTVRATTFLSSLLSSDHHLGQV